MATTSELGEVCGYQAQEARANPAAAIVRQGVCDGFRRRLGSLWIHSRRGRTPTDHVFAGYVAGERYLEISANAEPRDFPHYCNLILGEGSLDWPERDWNSVALWRLIRARASTPKEAAAGEYPLGDGAMNAPIPEDLRPVFETMREDLLRFAEDFLGGDTRAFRRVRAAQTQERTPYIIHRPGPGGGYVASVDPTSAALKQRFSREEMG